MRNPEYVPETHILICDFEIPTDPLISANNQQKMRTYRIVDFAVLADHRLQLKENEKKDKYPDLARELKTVEHESEVIPIVIGALGTVN